MKKQVFFPLLPVLFLCFHSYFNSIILFSWLLVAILFLPIPVYKPTCPNRAALGINIYLS